MELWISKCNSNSWCYYSYFIIIFKYWIKKVFKIL